MVSSFFVVDTFRVVLNTFSLWIAHAKSLHVLLNIISEGFNNSHRSLEDQGPGNTDQSAHGQLNQLGLGPLGFITNIY